MNFSILIMFYIRLNPRATELINMLYNHLLCYNCHYESIGFNPFTKQDVLSQGK